MLQVFLLAGGWVVTQVLQPYLYAMLRRGGAQRPNYRGRRVLLAGGLAPGLGALIALAGAGLVGQAQSDRIADLITGVLLGLLAGLLDDFLGSGDTRGLRGHFRVLSGGELSTGALKAILMGGGALYLAAGSADSTWDWLVGAAVVALLANAINFTDLRPGRALKLFTLLALILMAAGSFRLPAAYLLAPVGAVLAYAPADLKGEVMLGDTGAAALGLALGLVFNWVLAATELKVTALVILVAAHLYVERYSLTALIARVSWLDYLDRLGVPAGEKEQKG